MIIQHNMQAMNANRMLGNVVTSQSKSTEKLSSGYRINRAGDDAAGLAISEKMRGQIRGLTQASTNAQDGISLIQTAEGALTETHSILQRMRELAVQASNDTNTDDDRTQIQNEIDQLTEEVNRIANTTEFNTKKLLDGSRKGSVSEKGGSIGLDSTFSNSNVSATVTTDGSAKAAFTDVIRIEATKDFTEGQSISGAEVLSEKAIEDIYQLLTDGTGNAIIDSDDFKSKMNANANKAPTNAYLVLTDNPTKKSLEEAIKAALTAEKTELSTMKEDATKAESAVDTNNDLMETYFEGLEKMNVAVKNANTSTEEGKAGLLAEGVTVDDVKAAFAEYVKLLAEDGTVTGNTSTATSEAILEAEKKLDAMFYTGAEKIATSTNVADKTYFETVLKKANGTEAAAVSDGGLDGGTEADIKDIAGTLVVNMKKLANQVAGTQVEAGKYVSDVAKQQKLVDTLSNTELTEAIFEYEKEDATLTAMKTAAAGTYTDSRLEEQVALVAEKKAALDKLNQSESALKVTDLFGNGEEGKNFQIGSKVNENGDLTITLKNNSDTDTVITIANADQLKAGDVLTVTTGAMVESKAAASGEEALRLQAGANAGQEISLGINSMKAVDLNIVQTKEGVEGEALDVTSQANASLAIKAYDLAIQKVSTERAKMGATQNRLEHTIANLDTSAENLQSAESRIRDVDMAEEMTVYSKNNILQQAAQSMLAQANQSTQGVLSLLQ